MLRYLGSNSTIKETSRDHFTATAMTHLLASPQGGASITHGFDTVLPPAMALPEYLKLNKYQDINDVNNTPCSSPSRPA